MAAAGRAGVKFDPEKIKLYFGGVEVFSKGVRSKPESRFASVFKKPSFTVTLSLGEGEEAYSILTSDLSHKYVSVSTPITGPDLGGLPAEALLFHAWVSSSKPGFF